MICISNLENKLTKTWSDRFDKGLHPFIEKFNASIKFDICLLEEDLDGSIAHARMLGIQGIISNEEDNINTNGLTSIDFIINYISNQLYDYLTFGVVHLKLFHHSLMLQL